jgi:hypothetical protein
MSDNRLPGSPADTTPAATDTIGEPTTGTGCDTTGGRIHTDIYVTIDRHTRIQWQADREAVEITLGGNLTAAGTTEPSLWLSIRDPQFVGPHLVGLIEAGVAAAGERQRAHQRNVIQLQPEPSHDRCV